MQINRCSKCMEPIQSYPCPHCGFTPESYEVPLFALRPNHILNGRYLVGKMLGQGGFGITYIGFDLNLNRRVAIKEFYPFGQVNRANTMSSTVMWSTDEHTQEARLEGLQSFKKEAEKMVRLEQVPQVVQVHDVFSENDTEYIVMEFAEGETLKSILQREGPMPWEKVKRIFFPIITAMDRVHKAGMVHRDISPDNLMIDSRGRGRILDLGAAKDLSAERDGPSVLVAKNGFSPVEQYGQRGGSGSWTDVYAMAATIYYTLTGHLPPSAIDRLENDSLNWNDPMLASVPEYAIHALQHAMAVSMKDRTQSMAAFLRELSPKAAPVPPTPIPATEPIPRSSYPKSSSQKPPISQVPTSSSVSNASSQPVEKKTNRVLILGGGAAALVVCIVLVCLFTLTCMGGHKWQAATCTTPKTCSRCGEQEGSPIGHTFREADCTTPQTCTVCGTTTDAPIGHDFTGASCTAPGICSRCGAQGSVLEHQWIPATDTTPETCSVCGETRGQANGLLGAVTGKWGQQISLGGSPSIAFNLDRTVERCCYFELKFAVKGTDTSSNNACNFAGTWTIWVHDTSDNTWKSIGKFDVPADCFDNSTQTSQKVLSIPVELSQDISFDSVSVKPGNTYLRWSMEIFLEDVRVHST